MNQFKGREGPQTFFQILFLGCAIILVVAAIITFIPGVAGTSQSSLYPPPEKVAINPIEPTAIVSTSTPPLRDAKDGHILSPTEIAAIATFFAEKRQANPTSNKPTPTEAVYPVTSAADLPQVVYHDPFYGSDETGFGPCIQAKNPGPAVLVHSLDADPDYYIVPFFKDNQLCAKALVQVKNGLGLVSALGQARGDKYPQVSADEAVRQVVLKTGKQVTQKPILVFEGLIEDGDPLDPFWQVITADNQTYYVIFFTGPIEGNGQQITTTITVLSANEVHPLN